MVSRDEGEGEDGTGFVTGLDEDGADAPNDDDEVASGTGPQRRRPRDGIGGTTVG